MKSVPSTTSYAVDAGFDDGFDKAFGVPSPRRTQRTKCNADYIAAYFAGRDAGERRIAERLTGVLPDADRN
jgi:hypothetical protein